MNKTCIVLLNIIFKNNMTKPQYMFAQNLVYGIACRITRLCHTSHWYMCILEGCICQHSFLGHTTLDNRIPRSQLVRCRGWVAIYLYRGTWLYTRSEVRGANDPTLYRGDVVISGCQAAHYTHSMIHVSICSPCSWRRHKMETYSTLLALCARNSPAIGEFPAQRPGALMFSFICARIYGWVNNCEAPIMAAL